MRHMAQHLADRGDTATALRFQVKAQAAEQRLQQIKQLVFEHEPLSEEQLREPQTDGHGEK
jgi:hypothetical protein